MNPPLRRLSIALLLLLLAGCSARPDEATLEALVRARVMSEMGEGIALLSSFRKLNGIPGDANHYSAEVAYQLHFLVDIEEAVVTLQRQRGGYLAAGMEAARLGMRYGNFRAGDILQRREQYRFVRSERGWMIDEPPR